ncbi:MAG: ATP12 family chaperone protein [Alphaproteobacteria bacterium]
MKRFYAKVETAPAEGGFAIMLDGRVAKTKAKRPLTLPNAALADAVAQEWRTQADQIRPDTLPFTRFAATAIDMVAERRDDVVWEIANYAATDLVCYRAAAPADLARRQREGWQPLLDWLAEHHGARLRATTGVVPIAQRDDALAVLYALVADFDDHALVALHALATACGSLVIALALADGRIDAETAWDLSQIDERYKIEKWGEDAEATQARAAVAADFHAAARFLKLSRS